MAKEDKWDNSEEEEFKSNWVGPEGGGLCFYQFLTILLRFIPVANFRPCLLPKFCVKMIKSAGNWSFNTIQIPDTVWTPTHVFENIPVEE